MSFRITMIKRRISRDCVRSCRRYQRYSVFVKPQFLFVERCEGWVRHTQYPVAKESTVKDEENVSLQGFLDRRQTAKRWGAARGKYARTYTLGFAALPINSYRWQPFPSQRWHLASLSLSPSLALSLSLSVSIFLRYPCEITHVTTNDDGQLEWTRPNTKRTTKSVRTYCRACKLGEKNVMQDHA